MTVNPMLLFQGDPGPQGTKGEPGPKGEPVSSKCILFEVLHTLQHFVYYYFSIYTDEPELLYNSHFSFS